MRLPQKDPLTIEQAAQVLFQSFSKSDEEYIRREKEVPYHFASGMSVRNEWKLWEKDSPLKLDAIKRYGLAHADDISGLIFEWAFAKVRDQPFDPLKHAEQYHKHWKKLGTTSIKAGGGEE